MMEISGATTDESAVLTFQFSWQLVCIIRRFNAIVSQLWFWPFWVMFLNLWLKVVHIDQRQNMNWPLADNFESTNVTFLPKKLASNVQSSCIDNSKWLKSELRHYCIKATNCSGCCRPMQNIKFTDVRLLSVSCSYIVKKIYIDVTINTSASIYTYECYEMHIEMVKIDCFVSKCL